MKIFKQLGLYILVFIGFLLVALFIWFRFLRIRLPREIPFDLSLFGFIILITTCILYFTLLIIFAFNITFKPGMFSKIISICIKPLYIIIFKPLIAFDEYIKTYPFTKYYIDKILIYISKVIENYNYFYLKDRYIKAGKLYNVSALYNFNYNIIQLIFIIIPRTIILLALLIDVFYFHCIYILYKVIILSLLPLAYKYIIYSFNYAKEEYIKELESMADELMTDYYVDDDDDMDFFVNREIRFFIEGQMSALAYESTYDNKIIYRYFPLKNEWYISDEETEKFKKIMSIVIQFYVHVENFQFEKDFEQVIGILKKIKIITLMLYLLCWTYILVTSIVYTFIITYLIL